MANESGETGAKMNRKKDEEKMLVEARLHEKFRRV